MAHYLSPDVSESIEANSDDPLDLVLVVEETELGTIVDRAEEYDVRVVEEIEPNIVVVNIEAARVEEFCRPSYIKSVSFDESMEVLDSGNLSHPST